MENGDDFYKATLSELIRNRSDSILVCGGGMTDKEIFESTGFTNVTISNIDKRMDSDAYLPFSWKYENAASLSFNDESFDFTVIHNAIHHSSSPHRVLTEMYRVAKKGVLAIESHDVLIVRILEKMGMASTYEVAAVHYNDCKYGGVNNSEVPNFVFRWTEREVEKTIKSYAPHAAHQFIYRYGTRFPGPVTLEKKAFLKLFILNIMQPLYRLYVKLFPKQQNLFAFYVHKPMLPKMLHPWLKWSDAGSIRFNAEWAERKYKDHLPIS